MQGQLSFALLLTFLFSFLCHAVELMLLLIHFFIFFYFFIIIFYSCPYSLGWLLWWTTTASIIFMHFYPSSLEMFLMECTRNDLSSVESFTAWYWASCYLQIREDIYLWYGTVVNLFVPRWCGVQFTNWKIMRVIMANHSLKFKCGAFFFPAWVWMKWHEEDIWILSHYIDTLNYMKKPLLVYGLNIFILNVHVIIPSAEPHCGCAMLAKYTLLENSWLYPEHT